MMIYFYKMFISFLVAGFFSTHAFAWSEGIVKGGSIKGTHINEFRNLINLKRQCLGLSPTVWTDASITTRATPIRAQHFIEIKNSASEILSLCPNSTATYACTVTGSVPGFLGKLKESFKGSIKASDFNFMRNYLDAITCTPWTYGWLVGSYGACAGGSGIWSYSPWGICSGTTRSTTYGGWGACVADMETRSVTTADVPNSGSQGRTGICNGNFNSGTQTRTVQCQRSDGLIVADSFCTTPKPLLSSACTPTDPAVCGAKIISQACPSSPTNPVVSDEVRACRWLLSSIIPFAKFGKGAVSYNAGAYDQCVLVSFTYDGDGRGYCRLSGTTITLEDEGKKSPQICNVQCSIKGDGVGSTTVGKPCAGGNGIFNGTCCAQGTTSEGFANNIICN